MPCTQPSVILSGDKQSIEYLNQLDPPVDGFQYNYKVYAEPGVIQFKDCKYLEALLFSLMDVKDEGECIMFVGEYISVSL